MIDLSVTAGYVLAPPKRWQGPRATALPLLNYLPPVKRYFLEMRFKPMPQYREGALLTDGAGDLAGGQNVYSTAGDAGERRERAARRGYRGEFRHYRLGLQPAVGAQRRADRPLARDWRALYPVVPEVQIQREQDNAPARCGGRYAKPPQKLVCTA